MKTESNYLVETALVAHGVSNLKEEDILSIWRKDQSNFAWLNKGNLETGSLKEFLNFKSKNNIDFRVSSRYYEAAKCEKLTGALTASGTMCACEELDIPFSVSAGIGGIGDIMEEPVCPDLQKIVSSDVTLVATTFKDMMDRSETFKWLKQNDVEIFEKNGNKSTGFMFKLEILPTDAMYQKNINIWKKKQLLLNEITMEQRLQKMYMLEEMVIAGRKAEEQGDYYHPAANNRLAELTHNGSSVLQLRALLDNAQWTQDISS